MAAINNSDESSFNMNKQINGWMLEFICKTVWEEFKQTHQVHSSSRDFVQGILCRFLDRTPQNICRMQLLVMMCKLMDGEQYGMQYREGGDLTVLEEVVISFDSLVSHVHGRHDIRARAEQFRTLILKQAVFVCCRAGDFEMAEKVVERQWTNVNESALDAQKEVLEALQSEGDSHETVTSNSYEEFMNKIISFLEEIFDCLPEPFLLKLAKNYDEIVMGDGDASDSVKSSYFEMANKDGRSSRKSLKQGVTASLKDKLHHCRAQTMKQLASCGNNLPGRKSQRKQSKQDCTQNTSEALHNGVDQEDGLINVPHGLRTNALLKRTKEDRKRLRNATNNYAEHFPLTPRFQSFEEVSEEESSRNKNKNSRTSTPMNMHDFKYNKNRNRSDRHVHHSPNDTLEVSDVDIDVDRRPSHLKPIHDQHTIKPHLQYESKFKNKRKMCYRLFWTPEEEESFYLKVKEHGVGNWTVICKDLDSMRTNVSLKDKWRQMKNSGRINELIKKYGAVKK